jgi:hypothetical protein
MKISTLIIFILGMISPSMAEVFFVGKAGKRGNPGTADAPLGSIQEGVNRCGPGDECVALPGVYYESVRMLRSGRKDAPILLRAQGKVILDGTDPLLGAWEKWRGAIYRIPLTGPAVEQAFSQGIPLSPARWPNARFQDTWIRSKWAQSAEGSRKDLMVCAALTQTGIDWTGATAVLNVGHQYKTWTRRILTHGRGKRSFTYALEERLGDGKDSGPSWWNDRFYITDSLKALDAPGEWFHDAEAGYFYLVTDDDKAPASATIRVKRRKYGIVGEGLSDVQIRGFQFFGCAIRLTDVKRSIIEQCDIRFPSAGTMIGETMPRTQRFHTPVSGVSGDDNLLKGLYVAYASGGGLQALGRRNRIEDCIVHDICWSGAINFAGIAIAPAGSEEVRSSVSRCTVYNTGNIGISFRGRANVVEYNHVHHTGLACHDIAAIHTGSPATAGSVARYNWVHHSMGKGMRGDDQTRRLTFHHNLVWNCDEGIIVKGDHNRVYHNTILGSAGHGGLIIPTRQEPKKWWTRHEILPIQNVNSLFFNNYCELIAYRHEPLPHNQGISHNMTYTESKSYEAALTQAQATVLESGLPDARPRQGSIIIDQGMIVAGLTDNYAGTAPDIGAYEFGKAPWRPGASRPEPPDIVLPIEAEVARSWHLASKTGAAIPLPRQLRESQLNELSKKKLQTLYASCWQPQEIHERRKAIQERAKYSKGAEEYSRSHAVVVQLHQTARKRLVEKAATVLTGSELKRFYTIMGVK